MNKKQIMEINRLRSEIAAIRARGGSSISVEELSLAVDKMDRIVEIFTESEEEDEATLEDIKRRYGIS